MWISIKLTRNLRTSRAYSLIWCLFYSFYQVEKSKIFYLCSSSKKIIMFESQNWLLILFHGEILFFVSVPFKSGNSDGCENDTKQKD